MNKRLKGDLTLDYYRSPVSMSVETLTIAAKNKCRSCSLILDAVVTWAAGQIIDKNMRFRARIFENSLEIEYEENAYSSNAIEVARLSGEQLLFGKHIPNECSFVIRMHLDFPRGPAHFQDGSQNVIEVRKLTGDTCSNTTLDLITDWIRICEEHHNPCERPFVTSFPKSILEITTEKIYLQIQLESSANYACLSHCWGPKGPKFQLTTDTMDCLTQGYAISELTKTFRDAMKVCQNLGIAYLWIDALCESLH